MEPIKTGKDAYLAKKAKKIAMKEELKNEKLKIQKGKNNAKNIRIIVIVILLIVGAFAIVKSMSSGDSSTIGDSTTVYDATIQDNTLGSAETSKITLLEYSDFECPACQAFHKITDEILTEHGDDILFIYRHFPLSYHKKANMAASATEAAAKQDKFWEMYDGIFENQQEWSKLTEAEAEIYFEELAEGFGINMVEYRLAIDSDEVKEKIENDIKTGNSIRINATPTFFIDGEKVEVESFEQLKDLISTKINEAS